MAGGVTRIAVLGPGGVGGLIAALADRAGAEVTCVARAETASAIARDGIRVESPRFGDFTARPRAVERLVDPADVLVVATKAPALADALTRVAGARLGAVLPLLNGFEHLALLRERLAAPVATATIGAVQAVRSGPGHIEHRSAGAPRIEYHAEPGAQAALEPALELLRGGGVEVVRMESEPDAVWSKLVRLAPMALVTAAAQRPLGEVRSDPELRALLARCVEEACAVAAASGARADAEAVTAEIDGLPEGLRTSLQRDVAAGNASEADALGGAIVRAGRSLGLECPTIARLTEQLK